MHTHAYFHACIRRAGETIDARLYTTRLKHRDGHVYTRRYMMHLHNMDMGVDTVIAFYEHFVQNFQKQAGAVDLKGWLAG